MPRMTKEEFDKKYVDDRAVVNCKTEKEAIDFLKMAHQFGYKWESGKSFLHETYFDTYGEDTCYSISDGLYSEKQLYEELDRKIIEFSYDAIGVVETYISNERYNELLEAEKTLNSIKNQLGLK